MYNKRSPPINIGGLLCYLSYLGRLLLGVNYLDIEIFAASVAVSAGFADIRCHRLGVNSRGFLVMTTQTGSSGRSQRRVELARRQGISISLR